MWIYNNLCVLGGVPALPCAGVWTGSRRDSLYTGLSKAVEERSLGRSAPEARRSVKWTHSHTDRPMRHNHHPTCITANNSYCTHTNITAPPTGYFRLFTYTHSYRITAVIRHLSITRQSCPILKKLSSKHLLHNNKKHRNTFWQSNTFTHLLTPQVKLSHSDIICYSAMIFSFHCFWANIYKSFIDYKHILTHSESLGEVYGVFIVKRICQCEHRNICFFYCIAFTIQ